MPKTTWGGGGCGFEWHSNTHPPLPVIHLLPHFFGFPYPPPHFSKKIDPFVKKFWPSPIFWKSFDHLYKNVGVICLHPSSPFLSLYVYTTTPSPQKNQEEEEKIGYFRAQRTNFFKKVLTLPSNIFLEPGWWCNPWLIWSKETTVYMWHKIWQGLVMVEDGRTHTIFLEKPYPLKQVDNANAFTILVFNIRLQII